MFLYFKKVTSKNQFLRLADFLLLFIFFLITLNQSNIIAQTNSGEGTVRFLVISDWGGKASKEQKAVASAMGKEADRTRAQFVVSIGDNYHEDGIASETDIRWKTEFEDIYDAPSLQIPWYACLGNHDYRGNPEGEIKYSNYSKRWKMPSRYFAHEEQIDSVNSLLIIQLDTSPFIEEYRKNDSKYHVLNLDIKKQMFWLDSILTNTKASYILVAGHHPIYSSAPKHGDQPELIQNILPILQKHNVNLYLCGHDHVLQHIKRGEINFLVCGGGAEPRETADREDVIYNKGNTLGFLSVIANKDSLVAGFVDSDNNRLNDLVIKNKYLK